MILFCIFLGIPAIAIIALNIWYIKARASMTQEERDEEDKELRRL